MTEDGTRQSCGVLETPIRSADELDEVARDWKVDFRQLDAGRLAGRLVQAFDERSLITWTRFDRTLDQSGEAPTGMCTFGVLERGTSTLWHEREIDDGSLLVFRELVAVSSPGFSAFTISIAPERLAEVSRVTGIPVPEELVHDPVRALRVRPKTLHALRACVRRLCAPAPGDPGWRRAMERGLPAAVLRALAGGASEIQRPPSRVRDLACRRALEYVSENSQEPLTVTDLCRAVGVSGRTLEYAFRERFGMTPKAYLRTFRLNGVRRDLHGAEPGTRIADVANRWGFWHMGQFAADYRRQFGELPSESVRTPCPPPRSGVRPSPPRASRIRSQTGRDASPGGSVPDAVVEGAPTTR